MFVLSVDTWEDDKTKEYFTTELIERLEQHRYINSYNIIINHLDIQTNISMMEDKNYKRM